MRVYCVFFICFKIKFHYYYIYRYIFYFIFSFSFFSKFSIFFLGGGGTIGASG